MRYLYDESNFNALKKKKSHLYWLFAVDFVMEVVIVLICLLLSNYHSKLVFSIVGSVLSIGVVFFLIYLIDRFKKTDHLVKEYEALLKGKETIVEGTVIEISPTPITLPDGTKAYTVIVENGEENRTLLLSDIFDINILENKKYKFSTYYDYIRGFKDEI